MKFNRSAGVLLHPTSLPNRYGIGDLGESAYRFIDFLVAGKQQLWQILPLGPTGYGDSPYQSFSAFAGNAMLISPDRLIADGYLPKNATQEVPDFPTTTVDFGPVIEYKQALLQQSFDYFKANGDKDQHVAFELFCRNAAHWLDDYALFMALKGSSPKETNESESATQPEDILEGGSWNDWPKAIARRQARAMKKATKELAYEIECHKFQQFQFYKQWMELKGYANRQGIKIIGDLPIFVAYDSADVWANPELFHLNKDGSPKVVAGVPPDYFSVTGQRWGNPLYNWEKIAANDYNWWIQRIHMNLVQADIVRIDHFRGFEAYWEIPATEPTAVVGRWVKGPDSAIFEAIRAKLGELPIIAEDLGVITPEVEALRDSFGFPGMRILQFAFGGERNSSFLPYNYINNTVVYTGTHDNETTLGWYLNATEDERDHVRRYAVSSGRDIVWDLIRLAYASVADMTIIPMQDLFVLGNEARMNYPGKEGGWWRWRFTREMFTARASGIAAGLAELAQTYGRAPEETVTPTANSAHS